MPNNLYNQLNNNNSNLQYFGGFQQMITQFNQFRNSLQGDPQQIVQGLLQSARMSQAQFNQLSQMASQFKSLLYKG